MSAKQSDFLAKSTDTKASSPESRGPKHRYYIHTYIQAYYM